MCKYVAGACAAGHPGSFSAKTATNVVMVLLQFCSTTKVHRKRVDPGSWQKSRKRTETHYKPISMLFFDLIRPSFTWKWLILHGHGSTAFLRFTHYSQISTHDTNRLVCTSKTVRHPYKTPLSEGVWMLWPPPYHYLCWTLFSVLPLPMIHCSLTDTWNTL